MKLKKLEVTGFKSFVEKACIEFPPGVSAVVGPNGCGKSNILDALRWVMGEQSVKQLRGKSMEDVIFSGTNGNLPMNMAEVSLTLLNDNGSAPEELKEFTEINVTRRLYRSGESAYFINKQLCRLKDVHNIFLGSGMGPRSYAVIQQGNIGAITDAGPEERRVFIEEAAGITRYNNRKNEALRKVETTNQNLLRVMDIITEVKRQMDGLKRQAKKAELYKKYQEHIRKLDVVLSLHCYDDFTAQMDEADALLRDLKDTDIGHTSKLKKLDAAIEDIKLTRWQKNQEISSQKSHKFETQRTIDRIENDLAHLRKDVEGLTNEISELESARTDLDEKNKNILSEISQVEGQNIGLTDEMTQIRSEIDRERLASQNVKDQLSRLNQELEACKSRLMERVAQEARYKNICQTAANNKESLKRRLKKADEEAALAEKKVAELLSKESGANKQLAELKEEVEEAASRIDTLREQVDEKSSALRGQVKLVQTLELERNKARSQYAALKKMEDNFEWYKDGVRAIMKRSKSAGSAKGSPDESRPPASEDVIGLMADIVEPEPSFETAVEAALGESLQYILVKDAETAQASINYLQTQEAGRSGFIPVSSVKQMECERQKMPDPSKLLLNHVSVKPGFEKITGALLGHVVVTEDMQEAIKTHSTNGVFQTIVTKDGHLISHQGIMIGGSKDNLSGILAKKKELKELEGQIAHLDKKWESGRQDQKKLEDEVLVLENKLQQTIEQKNKIAQNEIEAEKALYKVTEDLKHARRYLEIVCLEQEQLLGEESDIDQDMAKHHHALAEIENEVKAAQNKVAETSEKISAISSAMEDFNQKIVDLQLKLTTLNARLENSNHTLKRLQEFKEDGIKRLEQLTEEVCRKHQKKETSKLNILEYEQRLSEMYADMKRLEQALERNEADYQAIDAALKENDTIISDIQNKREEILQKIRLLELEQSQRGIKRENIAGRMQERYHRSISELKTEFSRIPDTQETQPQISVEQMENELTRYHEKISRIPDVNLGAITEYEQLKARYDFLCEQRDDLVKAVDDLHKVIKKINHITQERFLKTFEMVNEKLVEVFPRLFEGGTAELVLTEPDKPLETGVELMIHPPGKKLTRMSLLSGGEKALSAIALIFSIFLIKPTSFCLLDEIDAPLDDANVYRFNNLLQLIGEQSQIIMITHNKKTMEFADTLFGITMEKKGISKIVSVNLNLPEETKEQEYGMELV